MFGDQLVLTMTEMSDACSCVSLHVACMLAGLAVRWQWFESAIVTVADNMQGKRAQITAKLT